MKLKALKSFIGKVSMNIGEIKEVVDEKIAKELIRAGHAIELKEEKKQAEKQVEKEDKPATKKNNKKK